MRTFDYSFLRDGSVPARFVSLASDISTSKATSDMQKKSHRFVFSELESIARVQSVRCSNAIEGIVTSDERIRAIVNGSAAPLDHDEAEIAGYRDALSLVHENHRDLDFRRKDILALHRVMMSYLGPEAGGRYKTDDNAIIEIDPLGRRSVRFQPTSAEETAETMEQLELAYIDARDDAAINRLLLIPCVILDFLCIHPFHDGNGRISRLLSTLLLYRCGYDVSKYVSFEQQVNKMKESYYDALRESSAGWHENENSYFPFMESFLATLRECYRELDKRFDAADGRRVTKTQRIESAVLESAVPISKSQISSLLPDVSVTTIEKVLHDLVKSGRIARVGAGRASKYIAQ